jgi:hypothetical protein
VLDRASTFADPEIVELLKSEFVPVAIDQAYQRRQKDTEGQFYRKIAGQGPRNNFQSTTQGFYIATPSGELMLYNNNRDPAKLRRLMRQKLAEFKTESKRAGGKNDWVRAESIDKRFNVKPPEGGLVLRVRAKVMGGYEPTSDQWREIFQSALSRDNLWITAEEHRAIVSGVLPVALQRRIARYHLVDNTRGEPPIWKPQDIRGLNLRLDSGEIRGDVQLQNEGGDRGYQADVLGRVESADGKVTRLDIVVRGDFWGEGPFTGRAPKGKFPLAISFTLADQTDVADQIPPQGSRGWLDGYLRE